MFNPLTDKHTKTVFVDGTTQLTNVVGIDSNAKLSIRLGVDIRAVSNNR